MSSSNCIFMHRKHKELFVKLAINDLIVDSDLSFKANARVNAVNVSASLLCPTDTESVRISCMSLIS